MGEGAELVTASYLQFEREEGSLEAWEAARRLCRAKLARAEARQEKERAREAEEEERRVDKVERKKEKDKQYRREKRQEEASAKRQGNGAGGFKEPESSFTKPKAPVEPPPGFKPPPGFEASKKRTIEPPPGFKEPSGPSAKRAKTMSDEEFEGLSETKQREVRTVFLSNLSYEVTDQDIREAMATSGAVTEVRLVKTPAGKSKGFAFVEFEARAAAEAALARWRINK